jgi:hypothetical protein
MKIINTFISDAGVKIPEYTVYSLRKLRELNPDVEIDFICNTGHGFENVFKIYRINWINQNRLKSFYLESFWSLSNLERHGTPNTKYPSPPKFFHRALERIFMLQAYMSENKECEVFHTENDVLTYYPLDLDIDCHTPESPLVYITPMGPKVSTFAFCYFHNHYGITEICTKFLEYLWMGDDKFIKLTGADMLNEMTMLKQAQSELNIGTFDIIRKTSLDPYLFDPGSYGQYLGGTNNHDHGPGYAGDHHYIGAKINSMDLTPYWDSGQKKPFVVSTPDDGSTKTYPLFNLHIHSKNLKAFQ